MHLRRLKLKNWRNFAQFDLPLRGRQFVLGPNASGKSNLLDAVLFLHDVARAGGGLQAAVQKRGGLDAIRWMGAGRDQEVALGVEVSSSEEAERVWTYELGIKQGKDGPQVSHEGVLDPSGKFVLNRKALGKCESSRAQTHLEQAASNGDFAEIPALLAGVQYRNLVPQLLRQAGEMQGQTPEGDPYGQGLLVRMAETPVKARDALLGCVSNLLRAAVPGLEGITLETDKATGRPHLRANYTSGCGNGAAMREDQMSDGTLCLIGMAWSLLESEGLLLLEEPERNLHEGVVQEFIGMLFQAAQRNQRQFFISTHSAALLSDAGISPESVILLRPGSKGTEALLASDHEFLCDLLLPDDSVGKLAIPLTQPRGSGDILFALR